MKLATTIIHTRTLQQLAQSLDMTFIRVVAETRITDTEPHLVMIGLIMMVYVFVKDVALLIPTLMTKRRELVNVKLVDTPVLIPHMADGCGMHKVMDIIASVQFVVSLMVSLGTTIVII